MSKLAQRDEISPVRRLWLACLTAVRSHQPDGKFDAQALEEFLGQLEAAVEYNAPANRSINRQAESVEKITRQGKPEPEIERGCQ